MSAKIYSLSRYDDAERIRRLELLIHDQQREIRRLQDQCRWVFWEALAMGAGLVTIAWVLAG